jgi:hypothetical protein
MSDIRKVGFQTIGWAFVMLPFAILTFIGIQGYGYFDLLRYVFPLITLSLFYMGAKAIHEGTSVKAWNKANEKENRRYSDSL